MSVLGVVLQFLVVSRAYPDSNVLSDTEHVEGSAGSSYGPVTVLPTQEMLVLGRVTQDKPSSSLCEATSK